jgi:uncharacterized protein (DUF58 family)
MRFFTLLYRYSQWIKRRFTSAGLYMLSAMTVAAVFGVDTTLSMAYQIFTLLTALLLLALVGALRFQIPVTVYRKLPRFATVGETSEYTLLLNNQGTKRHSGLLLRDNLAVEFPSKEEFHSAKAPGDEKRNKFDQKIGYPRWLWLVQKKQGANIGEINLPDLHAKAETKVKIGFTPIRRGTLSLSSVSIGRTDPLGLVRTFMNLPCPDKILVLPRRYPVPGIQLPGLRKYQRGGVALSSKVGDTEEFSSLRDYRPGDAMRNIHWKSWAKTGRPVVKEYQDEFFVRHALMLDTFAAPQDAEHFEEAVSVAASLVYTVQEHDSLLDLVFVEDRAYCMTSGRNVAQVESMLQVLSAVSTCQDKPFSRLSQFVAGHAHAMSGCICVLLAWDAPRQALVENLQALGIPLLVLVISAPGAAPIDPGPMRTDPSNFHVLESGKIGEGLRAI